MESMETLLRFLRSENLGVSVTQNGSERGFYVKEIFLRNKEGKLVAYAMMSCNVEWIYWSGGPQKTKINELSCLDVKKGFEVVMACLVFLGTPSRGIKFTLAPNEVPFWEKILETRIDASGEVLIDAKEAKRLGGVLLQKVIPPHIWDSTQTRSKTKRA